MQIISLFGGIEGFGLAGHKMGWDLVLSCEIAEFPSLVTKRNFPNTFHHPDIHTLNYETIIKNSRWNPSDTTIVVGGFPCQPYSIAGKRKGKNDDRHLWPEMLRVIQEVQPTWVVGENVPGLVNWSEGMVFEEVQSDLEAEGYEVQSFILPAAGVGAPHRRDRVWIVAYRSSERCNHGSDNRQERQVCNNKNRNATEDKSERNRRERRISETGKIRDASNTKGEQGKRMQPEQREFSEQGQRELRGVNSAMGCGDASNPCGIGHRGGNKQSQPDKQKEREVYKNQQHRDGIWGQAEGCSAVATNPSNTRLQRSEKFRSIASEWPESDKQPAGCICPDWQNFPTQSPVCDGNDGISADLVRYILRTGGDCYTEEEAEKEAKKIISKVRAEGIKAGGNAIVHQVALQIFQAIEDFENQLQKPAQRR